VVCNYHYYWQTTRQDGQKHLDNLKRLLHLKLFPHLGFYTTLLQEDDKLDADTQFVLNLFVTCLLPACLQMLFRIRAELQITFFSSVL
jgi:hypothetical protein